MALMEMRFQKYECNEVKSQFYVDGKVILSTRRLAVSRERCRSSRNSCKSEGGLALCVVVLRTMQLHVSAL